MKRKIIFPDPQIWTRKDDMSINTGDFRRAGVLLKHHIDNNRDGVNVILDEALDAGRATNLIAALLETLDAVAQQLLTNIGLQGFDEWLGAYANPEFGDYPDTWRRAARLITAHGNKDNAEMDAILAEGSDDNVTPLILTAINVYTTTMPVLSTHIGAEILNTGIAKLAGMEAEGEL